MLTGTPEASSVAALQANLSTVLPELLLIVDGIFGRETQQAVRVFQAREGLPVTGIADLQTWELLSDRAESARVSQLEAEPLRLALLPGQILRAGEKNRRGVSISIRSFERIQSIHTDSDSCMIFSAKILQIEA